MVSEQRISALPTFEFNPEAFQGVDANDSRCKCLVCQFVYEEENACELFHAATVSMPNALISG